MARGAKPNEQNNEGNTALHYACGQNHETVVEFLLQKGWKPSVANNLGETPLRSIAEKGFESIELLLTKYDETLDEYKVPAGSTADLPPEEDIPEETANDEELVSPPPPPPAVSAPEVAEAGAGSVPAVGDASLDEVE